MKPIRGFIANALAWLDDGLAPASEADRLQVARADIQPGCPLDMLLIDTSGSMSESDYDPSRLAAAKHAACRFITTRAALAPDGCIAVISFSSNPKVVAAPSVLKRRSDRVCAAVQNLESEGWTKTAKALEFALKEIERLPDTLSPRIVLLTDGHSNSQHDSVSAATHLKERGVQLDIIGIGGSPDDVNEVELRAMASKIDGQLRYWFITSAADLLAQFERLALRAI
jgi:Mg-chelatase subunit ChlD